MKTEKLSLKNIKNVLGREEMKKIMAGSGSGPGGCSIAGQSCDVANGGFCCSSLTCHSPFGEGSGTCQ
ncbi:MAG TPA: hypothetical protein VK671_14955 [Mucilaginibacter sp.]|nr:hypothetical protein [Mucilaginibacter sp.]